MSDRHPHTALRLGLCAFCARGDQPVTVCGQQRSPVLYRQQQPVSSSSFSLNSMLACVCSQTQLFQNQIRVFGAYEFSVSAFSEPSCLLLVLGATVWISHILCLKYLLFY